MYRPQPEAQTPRPRKLSDHNAATSPELKALQGLIPVQSNLAADSLLDYPAATDKAGPEHYDAAPDPDGAGDRQRRVSWEATCVAQAKASAAAGRLASSDAVDAWIDSLDTDDELQPPRSDR